MSVSHLSPLGSQVSFTQTQTNRIENVADWEAISKKYRALFGNPEETGSVRDSEAELVAEIQGSGQAQVGNNVVNSNAVGNQV